MAAGDDDVYAPAPQTANITPKLLDGARFVVVVRTCLKLDKDVSHEFVAPRWFDLEPAQDAETALNIKVIRGVHIAVLTCSQDVNLHHRQGHDAPPHAGQGQPRLGRPAAGGKMGWLHYSTPRPVASAPDPDHPDQGWRQPPVGLYYFVESA